MLEHAAELYYLVWAKLPLPFLCEPKQAAYSMHLVMNVQDSLSPPSYLDLGPHYKWGLLPYYKSSI